MSDVAPRFDKEIALEAMSRSCFAILQALRITLSAVVDDTDVVIVDIDDEEGDE